jgi:hypothetical protein
MRELNLPKSVFIDPKLNINWTKNVTFYSLAPLAGLEVQNTGRTSIFGAASKPWSLDFTYLLRDTKGTRPVDILTRNSSC